MPDELSHEDKTAIYNQMLQFGESLDITSSVINKYESMTFPELTSENWAELQDILPFLKLMISSSKQSIPMMINAFLGERITDEQVETFFSKLEMENVGAQEIVNHFMRKGEVE